MLDRVITGELDGAHMLAGQPLGATIGIGTKADVVTAFSMDLNGNAITVSNDVWQLMQAHVPKRRAGQARPHPIKAAALEAGGGKYSRQPASRSSMAMVFPVPPTTTSCATGSRPAGSIRVSTRRRT